MAKKLPISLCFILVITLNAAAYDQIISAKSAVNWNTEAITSVISLDVEKTGLKMPTSRNEALRILNAETPGLLKDTFFSIIIDSSQRLGDAVESGAVSLADINEIIDTSKKTPPRFSLDLKQLSTTHTFYLADIGSLFIKHRRANPVEPSLYTVPTRAYSGILIDARGTLPVHGEYTQEALSPCIFPRIWGSDMDLLYEKNTVDPAVALKRGIVYYTASSDESRYRDRIGADPLRITARGVYGQNRTDPVISQTDFLRIVSSPENRNLLRDGKIVILCDQETLENSMLGPVRDENYYFTRQEIEKILAPIPVTRMDVDDSWEGLKISIYDIRFIADSPEILPEEQERFNIIADILKIAGPNASFTVKGHTANVGNPSGEQTLSELRAEKIAEQLVSRGIPADKIQTAGFGARIPIDTNETADGRARNRRAEIIIKLN
ncbi:OmpA family protein [Brucepastera parasyntrophica]|uniref:OmpA family protein n=1 Tax=Brucepastera parasyntrophica TaxID=2880008 RepID=UPI00210EED5F|nr:OmpA family protein [Brucepastera parasyntrophica]ULQ60376.1 OmpA family protein [Brucepastera parasyntrophica]